MLVNNDHGREVLERFGDGLRLYEVAFDDIAKGNDQLRHPSVMPSDRDAFLKVYRDEGWDSLAKWWHWHQVVPSKIKTGIKNAAKAVLPKSAVQCIKRMMGSQ